MQNWAQDELKYLDLDDRRLNQRCVKIVESLSAKPEASIPQAMGSQAAAKATYRFWDSKKVTSSKILTAHHKATLERIKNQQQVLLLQDTTSFNYNQHSDKEGLGYLEGHHLKGFFVHNLMACTQDGVPLGVIHTKLWNRPLETKGKKHQRKSKPINQKESYRWIESLNTACKQIPERTKALVISDAESDIYEYLTYQRPAHVDLLLRAAQNRRVETGTLKKAIADVEVSGQITVEVCRRENQKARNAKLSIRFAPFRFLVPEPKRAEITEDVELYVVLAEEDKPPAGVKGIYWLLITSRKVETFEKAVECAQLYSYRWLIERYHYVLKSGCGIEKLQLKNADRLGKAFSTYALAAWRLLWLTYLARKEPKTSCEEVLEPHEWQALYCMTQKKKQIPKKPPNLKKAVEWIAQLGGFLGRKGDGDPGVKVIWRGLTRLHDMAEFWEFASQNPHLLKQ